MQGAAMDRPQTAEDTKEGGLATAVGPGDEEVSAALDGKGKGGNEDVAVWGDNGDVVEGDVGAGNDTAAALQGGGVGGSDELLFEVSGVGIGHYVEEGGDAGGVAG